MGTSEATAIEAANALAGDMPRPRAYGDAETMLEQVAPDVLIIASPPNTHARFLYMALTCGAHVLCEKPVAWSAPDARAEPLAQDFQAAGLHLVAHAQWPFTLPYYRTLHPTIAVEGASSFEMRLSPRRAGLQGLVDSLSHPLSVLATALPDSGARLRDASCEALDADRTEIRFVYEGSDHAIRARVSLCRVPEAPRPAAYAFDGAWAHRSIALPDYTMTLHDGAGRGIPLPDPSRLLVGSLFERIAAGSPVVVDPAVVPGVKHLTTLWRVAREVEFPDPS